MTVPTVLRRRATERADAEMPAGRRMQDEPCCCPRGYLLVPLLAGSAISAITNGASISVRAELSATPLAGNEKSWTSMSGLRLVSS